MRVKHTETGEVFTAKHASDLVHQMHQTGFSKAASDAEFMTQTAERYRIASGITIRSDTAWHFYADLVKAKVLKQL